MIYNQHSAHGELRTLDPNLAYLVESKHFELKNLLDHVSTELHEMGLSWYEAHAWAVKRLRGPKVRTVWLAAGLEKKTLGDTCRWVAASVFREWLDFKIYGTAHWSHIEYAQTWSKSKRGGMVVSRPIRADSAGGRGGPRGRVRTRGSYVRDQIGLEDVGQVKAGSLRIACDDILEAHNTEKGVEVFGPNVASKFKAILNLPKTDGSNPTAMIRGHLRALLKNAAQSVSYWLPTQQHSSNGEHSDDDVKHVADHSFEPLSDPESLGNEVGSVEADNELDSATGDDPSDVTEYLWCGTTPLPAKHSAGLTYFTHASVTVSELPWAGEKRFKSRDGEVTTERASEEWLDVVDLKTQLETRA